MTAGRLAKNSHIIGVTAKLGDIFLYPFQGLDNIQGAEIAGFIQTLLQILNGWMGKPAESAQPVVNGYHHHIFALHQPVVLIVILEAGGIATPMNPYHHRIALVGKIGGGFDIQIQAVFSADNAFAIDTGKAAGFLYAGGIVALNNDLLRRQ